MRGAQGFRGSPLPRAILRELRESTASDKFREFHRKEPHRFGAFADELEIPMEARCLGKAKHVLYRSSKKDPETGRPVPAPINYIHEHDAGVHVYVPTDAEVDVGTDDIEPVPDFMLETNELVLLGTSLGFMFVGDDGEHEVEATKPMPELYCTPCGRALVIVQDKREILALIWGGGLGVEARGIVG